MNTNSLKDSPIGHLVPISRGALAYVPAPLPDEVVLNRRLVFLLDEASRAVATLAGVGETLPDPNLLIQPFLRREAVMSSRIEGTQTLLSDLLLFEASNSQQDLRGDAREVLNYVEAMEAGLERLEELPISLRLINELHQILLSGTRGEEKSPGALRKLQVYIGDSSTPIAQSRYIPPPPEALSDLISHWEKFVNAELEMPPLVQAALMHYQFEAIHPYEDGNGRIGRLLITLFLSARQVLPTPLLYLSGYFERYPDEYINQLLNVSITGDWDAWLEFFLSGVIDQARDALRRSRRVRQLQTEFHRRLQERKESANAFALVDNLLITPAFTQSLAATTLGISRPGARGLLDRLVAMEILSVRIYGGRRFYVAEAVFEAIDSPTA